MKYTKTLLRAIVLFGIVALSLYALQEVNLAGKWNGRMQIPNFGTYEMTMVLEKTDSGYKGTVSDTMGYIAEGTEIEDLDVDDNELYGWFELTDGSVVTLHLTADGEIMTGEAERNGGVVSCVFVREK